MKSIDTVVASGRRAPARGYVALILLLSALPTLAEHEGPWQCHTIDNSSKGADGVRLADANGDGLMDIVTGWEEGGITRLYLNPGPEKVKQKWPAVTVGKTPNVEDAVMVDLDGDGAIDVVSSCEGKTKTIFVHWGPKDKTKQLDPDAWTTEPIPTTVGKQQWMYCSPIQFDGRGGQDLVVGSKGSGAAVGWLESPADRRDLQAWRYHKIRDAGWIMSIEKGASGGVLLVTDRIGPTRSVYELHRRGRDWREKSIERSNSEYMFGRFFFERWDKTTWLVATRSGTVKMYTEIRPTPGPQLTTAEIPNPFDVRHGKAVAAGRIDRDRHKDIVVSFNTQGQNDKPGVAWIQVLPDEDPQDWPAHDISGPEGKKFDRLELIDLDGDGDLDVLTCEEADNLGVIWYENPYGKPADDEVPSR